MLHIIRLSKGKKILLEICNVIEKSLFANNRLKIGQQYYLIEKIKKRKEIIEYFVKEIRNLWECEEIL